MSEYLLAGAVALMFASLASKNRSTPLAARTVAASARQQSDNLTSAPRPLLVEESDAHHPRRAAGRWNIWDVACVGALVIFSASRFNVGTDYPMYLNFFRRIEPRYWQEELERSTQEYGYTWLELAIKSITRWDYTIFWVAALATITPIYAVARRYGNNLPTCIFLYITLSFYVAPFNILRQGIALGINFYAATRLDRNRPAFLILNGIAGLIHATAWIAAVIQLLASNIKLRPRVVIVSLVAAAVAAAFFLRLAPIASAISALNPRYEMSLAEDPSGVGTYLVIAVRLGLLALLFWQGLAAGEERLATYAVIGTVFLILGTQSVALARMDIYFGIFLILLLPAHLKKLPLPVRTLAYAAFLGYFVSYLLSYGELLPYETYWTWTW